MLDQYVLFELLEKSLRYTPIVYKQANSYKPTIDGSQTFVLDYSSEQLPEDGLLFFLPSLNSASNTNTLIVRIPSTVTSKPIYSEIQCPIYIETNDGVPRKAGEHDIIAFRMCIFRFVKINDSYRAILLNSPLQNSIRCSEMYSTKATFGSIPSIKTASSETILVTKKEFDDLLNRVEKLESRITYGFEEPEDVLSSMDVGSIYIKLED